MNLQVSYQVGQFAFSQVKIRDKFHCEKQESVNNFYSTAKSAKVFAKDAKGITE